MKNEICYYIITLLLSLLVVDTAFFYFYWYDHEYPHGCQYIDIKGNNTIRYYSDYYGIDHYVSFNNKESYLLEDGMKEKIEGVLKHWNTIFNTTDFFSENPNTTYQFRVYFHTIDEPFECSSGYYKKKVIDDFELADWGSSVEEAKK